MHCVCKSSHQSRESDVALCIACQHLTTSDKSNTPWKQVKNTNVHVNVNMYFYMYFICKSSSQFRASDMAQYIAMQHLTSPHKKILGCGFSTPYTLFCFACTIHSGLNYFPIFTNVSEPGWISAGFQWMGSTPAVFHEAFRAANTP